MLEEIDYLILVFWCDIVLPVGLDRQCMQILGQINNIRYVSVKFLIQYYVGYRRPELW
jgi:hypothetical protein